MSGTKKANLWERHSLGVVFVALLAGSALLIYAHRITPYYPADSYFYLSKARNLVQGKGLTVNWNDGYDNKYFPGYSVLVGIADMLSPGSLQPWFPLQLLCLWVSVLLTFYLFKESGIDALLAATTAGALSLHFVVQKWSAVPSAEPTALVFILLSVLLFRKSMFYRERCDTGEAGRGRWSQLLVWVYGLGSFLLAGIAFATRVEAGYLWVIGIIYFWYFRKWRSFPAPGLLICGVILFFVPLLIWLLSQPRSEGSASLLYIQEFFAHLSLRETGKNFMRYLLSPFLSKRFISSSPMAQFLIYLLNVVGIVSILFGLRGVMGRRLQFVALISVGYMALHSFWYYSYERFMYLISPLLCLLLMSTCRAFVDGGFRGITRSSSQKQALFLIVAMGIFIVQGHYSMLHIKDHSAHLVLPDMDYREVASRADEFAGKDGSVLSQWGSPLAYYIRRPVFIDTDDKFYYRQMFSKDRTLEFLRKHNVRVLIIRQTLFDWMLTHNIPLNMSSLFKPIKESKHYRLIYVEPE